MNLHRVLFALLLLAPAAANAPGTEGGTGLALLTRKALISTYEGRGVLDNAAILIKDGHIEAVGPAAELELPEGYQLIDLGELWVTPGLIDLHDHSAGNLMDLNDSVYLTNPGLRAAPTITPGNMAMRRARAGGVTSVLCIPGSGSNISGWGILVRGGFDTFEENLIRNPGSLKLAQAGNPERAAPWYPRRTFMNWNTRNTLRRGKAYAKRWEAHEQGRGPKPERDLQFDIFRDLLEDSIQVSVHTQIYQVVNMTIGMVAEEFGFSVYIDHGTFDGFRAAARAAEVGVGAILGPRAVQAPMPPMVDTDGKILGVAAEYQGRGHRYVGFNTDAPVVPQEELTLQAAMGVRYGFDNSRMGAVRGLTIVPALTAGLDGAIGSIEPGKEADLIVTTGDPVDPRSSVEMVFQRGHKVYDAKEGKRLW